MWKLIFSSATNRGVGINRVAKSGEYSVELPPQMCGYFLEEPDRYTYNGSALVDDTNYIFNKRRLEAFNALKQRIVLKRQEKNSENFIYGGHPYISDEVNIQGVRIQVDGSPDSDPIPTFVGTQLASTWHTADDQFILFNAGQFRAFATAYFSHREKNFTNYTMLTVMATQAFNTGATVEQLNNFDISQGWN